MSLLTLKSLVYTNNKQTILENIDLEIEQGDCIAIIGPSGSGKSTLLKLCADLISPSSGHLIFKGKAYEDYDPIKLRRQISYCVQIPQLFGKIVYDNLVFPFKIRKEPVNLKRIKELLERFDLDESFLEKEIHKLSGGEKQRIAIIRNLLYTPQILLLDEATSALDDENAKRVEAYIQELNTQGVTVLWITHSLVQSESIFNKRITLSKGVIECMEVSEQWIHYHL